jgi:DNA-binding LacI/PurR family transcriptional regulator
LTNRGRFQPITFFSPEDQQQHDVVITSVTKRRVDGYVLSPKATNAAIAEN